MYRIKDWDTVFENNRTRELKTMQWVPVPNSFDGDGYSMIMEKENGAEIYGAWIACVNLASRCEPRGSLIKSDGTYHDIASISRITRVSRKAIETMISFCRDKCKWLIPLENQEGAENTQDTAGISHDVAHRARAKNGMEWNGKNIYTSSFESFWNEYPKKAGKGKAFINWKKAVKDTEPEIIISGAKRYAEKVKSDGTAQAYIKYPEGWLTGRRWEDEEESSGQYSTDDKPVFAGDF